MFRISFVLVGVVGCTSSSMMEGGGGGSGAPGTVVNGTLTFSPFSDSLDKFTRVTVSSNGQDLPQLEVFDEQSIGTGDCSMLALQDGFEVGASGWQFAAPAGSRFKHVSIGGAVYVDGRASSSTSATAAILTADGQQVDLMVKEVGSTQSATATQIDQAVAGSDHFDVVFAIENPGYTSELGRIFAQALRQCPGDATPFTISATYE